MKLSLAEFLCVRAALGQLKHEPKLDKQDD